MISTRSPLPLLLLLLAACEPTGVVDEDRPVAGGKADDPTTTVVGNHCEVFVDKAAAITFSQSFDSRAAVYVKTLNDRLDGKIVEVGFDGVELICLSCNVSESGGPTKIQPLHVTATPFVGSPDYFELELPLLATNDRDVTFQVEGVFFVQTDRGTRYTARAEPDDVAVLTDSLRFDLQRFDDDVAKLTSTGLFPADHPARQLFNPGGCF